MPQGVTIFALTIAPVPRSGTEELSPALQRWVGVMDEPSPSGTAEPQIPRLGLKSSLGMTDVGGFQPFRKRGEGWGTREFFATIGVLRLRRAKAARLRSG